MALVDTEDDGNKVLPLSGYAITCVLCLFSSNMLVKTFPWHSCGDTHSVMSLRIGTRLPVCGLSSLSIMMVSCT